jgi:glycosyltransferase involved in cell wall biosynthesis
MKILLFANTEWYLYNFRLGLAEALRAQGHQVILLSPPGPYGERLRQLGFDWRPFPFSTRSTNPLAEFNVIRRLVALYRAERPDLLHHFTIKCVLYGSLAARLAGNPPVLNAVTGLGHIFTDPGLKARLLRPLARACYRLALGGEKRRTIFQNQEDRDYFVNSGLVAAAGSHLIRGSGGSGDKFRPAKLRREEGDPPVVLFASRLLREKGVFELLAAARASTAAGSTFRLLIAGDLYPENPSSLTPADLETLRGTPGVEYLGHVDDMPALLARTDIVVLPSYREGTPRILVEAAAAGKPIVATDIAGCRGVVEDGVNGLLVPVRDVPALADALRKVLADAELRERFGRAGRRIFEAGFSEELVLSRTLAVYRELL